MRGIPSNLSGRPCRKCKKHGKINFLRYRHKDICEFKTCKCKSCSKVVRSREVSKKSLQAKRDVLKTEKILKEREATAFKGILPPEFRRCLHRGTPVAGNCSLPLTINHQSKHLSSLQNLVNRIPSVVMETSPVLATNDKSKSNHPCNQLVNQQNPYMRTRTIQFYENINAVLPSYSPRDSPYGEQDMYRSQVFDTTQMCHCASCQHFFKLYINGR